MREHWFEHGGVRHYAIERGEGRPVILLHGGLGNHLACWVFAAPLAERFRVITPDLRAAGRSIYAGELTWDDLAGDVAALARHLGLDRAVIGGVSSGAGVAVRVALRHPDVVDALLVLNPAYGGADLGLAPAQTAAMRAMEAASERALVDGVEALFPLLAALPDAMRERARAVFATYDLPSVAATTRFLASGVQPFARAAELTAIDAPTLVVPGTDPTHPAEVAHRFRDHVRRCTVREATPETYASVIGEFLNVLY